MKTVNLSKDAFNALLFGRQYPGWHSFEQNSTTLKAIRELASKGLVTINRFNQFHATKENGELLDYDNRMKAQAHAN